MQTRDRPKQRISRACLRCRQRKSKCNLGNSGEPPCEACTRDRVECVLAASRRGGRRLRRDDGTQLANDLQSSALSSPHNTETQAYPGATRSFGQQALSRNDLNGEDEISTADIEDTIASTDLHSTSDALNLLSQAATYATPGQRSQGMAESSASVVSPGNNINLGSRSIHAASHSSYGALQYPLVSNGLLSTSQVIHLVDRFHELYHPYLPIVPRRSFEPESLQFLASQEPHLLTAMITVAARDLPEGEEILRTCSSYMHQLVSQISAGKKCDVEAVEALLLLAEWEPQDSLSDAKEVGCGEEDRAAWMHVGLALRIGYFLGLDRTAIKHDDEDKAAHFSRRRVTWAACYISDRQLSARIGRAFWSRGPVAIAGVGRHGRQTFDEFPPLQPQTPDETDYASILQANLDLIQLFSNVHDVLYSGMGSSMKLMLAGNYVKFIDDFRRAIDGWKSIWGTLTCAPNIKATLQMTYEYLRLFTNAYAFQATVSRSVTARTQNSLGPHEPQHNGVPSLPDARFIYESVDAAKSLLSIVNSYVDAETCLRYLPLRFSLYCVNSAVFLYKAWSFDVLSTQEKLGIRIMINDVIRHLQKASVRPNDFTSRYSQLLERLWQRKDGEPRMNNSTTNLPDSHGFVATPSRSAPQYNHQQDEFSWLDLQAVGELVTGDHDNGFGMDGYTQFMTMAGDWSDLGLMDGEDVNRFF